MKLNRCYSIVFQDRRAGAHDAVAGRVRAAHDAEEAAAHGRRPRRLRAGAEQAQEGH